MASDHLPVITSMVFDNIVTHGARSQTKWKIRDANWNLYRETLKEQTTAIELVNLETTKKLIDVAAESSIPKRKNGNKIRNPGLNVWWNSTTACLTKARQRARRKWQRSNTTQNKVLYNQATAMAKKAILEAKRTSWKSFVEEITHNTPTAIVWRRFKAIEAKSYDPVQHVRDAVSYTHLDVYKRQTLDYIFCFRSFFLGC